MAKLLEILRHHGRNGRRTGRRRDNACIVSTVTMTITTIILLSPLLSFCQNTDTTTQIIFQKQNIQYFTLDPLQNLYAIGDNDLLVKYDTKGRELFTYNNTPLGQLTSIDATDPFNLLLFFPEQQNLVLLDRTLSERSSLDLRNTSIGQASAVALSHDNNIWVFDDFESQLVKIDANANILLQSDNLRLTENISEAASHIFRWKDKILVNFPTRGMAVFNLFAQLEDWWPLMGVMDGQVLSQGFAYYTDEGHFIYFPRPDKIEKLSKPIFNECTMVRIQLGQQYLLSTDNVLTKYCSIFNY